MADGWMPGRRAPLNSLRLSDELGSEDGTDPRRFFRRTDRSPNYKSKRLCGAAQRTLSLCLSSMLRNEGTRGLEVESVEPAVTSGCLLVILRTQQPLDFDWRARTLRALEATRGILRAEIASAISRRRVPDLRFLVLGPGEERS